MPFHVVGGIMPFGNGIGTGEQRTLEILRHEIETYHDMGYAQPLAMHTSEGYLTVVVIAAVMK